MFIGGKTQCRQTVIIVIVYWGFIKCEAWWVSSFRWIIFFYFSNNSTIYVELPCSFYKWRNWGSERQFALGHIKHWSGIWTPVVSTPQSKPLMTRLCCWYLSWLYVLRESCSTKLQSTEQLLGSTDRADSVTDILSYPKREWKERKAKG